MSRATALLPSNDPLRVDLIPNVRAIQGAADLGWADAILQEAIASGDPRLRAHALVQRGFLRLFLHDSDVTAEELIQVAEDAISVFENERDQLGLARAWRLISQSHYLARDGALSADAAETGLTFARQSGDRFEQQEIVEWLGIALVLGPITAAEGAAVCRRLLDQLAGDPGMELILTGALAYMVGIQGRTSEAEELVAGARQIAEHMEEQMDQTAWLFPVLLAFKLAWLSDPVSAERNLRPVYEGLKGLGEQSHFCSVTTMLAQATYEQRRYDEADELSREAERSSRPNDVHSHIVWRGVRAKVLAHRGDFEAAEKLAREAVEYAEASDFLHSHANALTDLAEVLALAGRPDESFGGDRGGDPPARGQGQRGRRRLHTEDPGRSATGRKRRPSGAGEPEARPRLASSAPGGLGEPRPFAAIEGRRLLSLPNREVPRRRGDLEARPLTTVVDRRLLSLPDREVPRRRGDLEARPFPTVEGRRLLSPLERGDRVDRVVLALEAGVGLRDGNKSGECSCHHSQSGEAADDGGGTEHFIPPGFDRLWCGRLPHLTGARLRDGKAAVKGGLTSGGLA